MQIKKRRYNEGKQKILQSYKRWRWNVNLTNEEQIQLKTEHDGLKDVKSSGAHL